MVLACACCDLCNKYWLWLIKCMVLWVYAMQFMFVLNLIAHDVMHSLFCRLVWLFGWLILLDAYQGMAGWVGLLF